MTDIEVLEQGVKIRIADGKTIMATKKGTFNFVYDEKEMNLEALIVPKLSHNLLSVSKLTRNGKHVIFTKEGAKIKCKGFDLSSGVNGQLYTMNFEVKGENKCMLANGDLWHRRLGHLNRRGLKILNLPISNKNCDACLQGKATRLPFKQKIFRNTKYVGELLHSDICGPFKTHALNGEKYFQTVTDDYSHFATVYLLKTKHETEENLMNYIKELKAQFGNKTARIRCDNGGEFSSNHFREFCKKRGIKIQYTIPYTPQQNGVSERMNRTLLDKTRTMLIDSHLPKHLWGEAVRIAAYQLNRSPTEALYGDVPSNLWYGKLDLSKLRVFGSKAWVYKLPKEAKLEPRAKCMRMVGYCTNGYKLWDPLENRIICARDVKFDERDIYLTEEKENDICQHQMIIQDEIEDKGYSDDEIPESRPKRERKLPVKLMDYELYSAFCSFTNDDPVTYTEAMKKGNEWHEAIEKELEAHEKLGTWIEAKLPDGEKVIDTKWVFKTKENGIKKARLVARGFQEDSVCNVYAPVARMSTVRMMVVHASQKNYQIRQLDIPTAFLNGNLKTDIYIKTPEGFKTGGEKERFFKLCRALYGLKEAPKCWNERFNDFATTNGFQRSKNDFCLYVKENVWMLIYVDDILLIGNDENVEETVKLLQEEFKAKDLGQLNKFLGMEINRTGDSVRISQKGMIHKILKKFNMVDCNGIKTPMESNFQVKEMQENVSLPYRELIGSLMYVSIVSRPDITFAVSYLSQFLDKPNQETWKSAKRVVRYLKETQNLTLNYRKTGDSCLHIYSDADWAGDHQDRKSVSGAIGFYCGNPISWYARKQQTVALSTAEAEYVAAAMATTELVSLKGIMEDFNQEEKPRSILFVDNRSAICMMHSFENSKRSKHIEIRHHFIKDLIAKDIFSVCHIPSAENTADILTKALPREKFEYFRKKMNIFGI